MILSDRDILEAVKQGDIKIEPFDETHVQSASIDLILDTYIYEYIDHHVEYIDIKIQLPPLQLIELDQEKSFILQPGEFILASTVERIELSSVLAARIDGRSSLGRLGLMIQTTAGHVSPGFSGNITLEISNISRIPIRLYVGMRIAQILFEVLSSPVIRAYGNPNLNNKYQGQKGATSSKILKDFDK